MYGSTTRQDHSFCKVGVEPTDTETPHLPSGAPDSSGGPDTESRQGRRPGPKWTHTRTWVSTRRSARVVSSRVGREAWGLVLTPEDPTGGPLSRSRPRSTRRRNPKIKTAGGRSHRLGATEGDPLPDRRERPSSGPSGAGAVPSVTVRPRLSGKRSGVRD